MIITSIFVFLTLIYREIGKYIIHPIPVKWKSNIDDRYLILCDRIEISRLERNLALETTFKLTSLVGFITLIVLTIIVGRNKFLLEIAILLSILLNLNFSFQGKKHFKQEIIRAILIASGLSLLVIIFFEFKILGNNQITTLKQWIGQILGDQHYFKRSTFFFYCVLIIVLSAIFGFLFRLIIGCINEVIYFIISRIMRFSKLLGEANALGVLLFMISSISYIISAIWEYNQTK